MAGTPARASRHGQLSPRCWISPEPEHMRCVPALVYPAGSCDAWSVLGTARRPPEPNPAAAALTFPSLHPGIPHSYQFSSRTSTAPAWGSERLNLSFLLFKKWFFFNETYLYAKHFAESMCGFGEWERLKRLKFCSSYQKSARDVNSSSVFSTWILKTCGGLSWYCLFTFCRPLSSNNKPMLWLMEGTAEGESVFYLLHCCYVASTQHVIKHILI